jgi:hypothetical protein
MGCFVVIGTQSIVQNVFHNGMCEILIPVIHIWLLFLKKFGWTETAFENSRINRIRTLLALCSVILSTVFVPTTSSRTFSDPLPLHV